VTELGVTRSVDLAELLALIRHEVGESGEVEHVSDERPHPALVALIVVGGLLLCCVTWGVILLLALSLVL